ncbi:hypothetical protein BDV36DRAFT_288821 [Aspergillus pseudocaelatus]|uniref:Uncharacterized protein n=1 Tax=Aspergillus pseudocaelatus TaxID=1825620 RepID=A0ABQ6W7H7_9EURO|nr:hypothetical protein BDV36DRAFT_288821 [Aspergillus pseudocaelatus]
MLSRLISILTPSITPSALLVIGRFGTTIHSRRVTLHVGDGETANSFLDDVETRICKLRNDSLSSNPAQLQIGSAEVTQLVQDVIQPAALDAIHEREGRDRSMHATQTYPVFVVYITRSRTGMI